VYDRQTHIVSLKLYLEASKLAYKTFSLHRQVLECQRELNALTGSYMTADLKRISDLRDEIFGCELEIVCIHVRVRRAIQQVEAMRSLEGYARVGSQNKAAFVQA
jgi:hypothetical protein